MNSLPTVTLGRLSPSVAVRALRATLTKVSALVTPMGLLLLMLVVGGILLRIQRVAEPPTFTFDEELFAKNAHNYLVRLPDANDHPPLGKLLISVGLLLFGYNSLGWRFVSLCFGLIIPLVGYFLGRALFQNRQSGWYATAFLASDGFFVAYSRVGLLDGMLTCFVLLSVLAAVTARNLGGVLLSAVLAGLASSVKWSGVMSVVPAAAAVLVLGRVPRWTVLAFALVPALHVVVWMLGLAVAGQPHELSTVAKLMTRLFWHHLELGKKPHSLASPWYTWIGLYHPIVVKVSQHGITSRYASSVGNPLLWLNASLLVIGLPLACLFRRSLAWFRRRPALPASTPERAGLLLALGWLALLAPWTVARGTYTFMYHYLPSYGFALVLLAGGVAYVERRWPKVALGFIASVVLMAAYFAPVWGEFPLSEAAAHGRLVFRAWQP
jgi:dolichyl-phosphate-mannose-protein mannosyltransferase